MAHDSEDEFDTDQWETDPPYSSFARTHSVLRMTSSCHSSRHLSSPRSMHKLGSGPEFDLSAHHITPEWQYLDLRSITPRTSRKAPVMPVPDVAAKELQETCRMIKEACNLRHKWLYKPKRGGHLGSASKPHCIEEVASKIPTKPVHSFRMKNGIATVFRLDVDDAPTEQKGADISSDDEYLNGRSFDDFLADLRTLYVLMAHGPAKTLCYTRSKIMQRRFQLHLLLNRDVELAESASVPYRDFYNVRKVDNNIHLSACMQQKHLLQFMRTKHEADHDRVVTKDGKTLSEVFKDLGIEINHLSVDKLDRGPTFQRFDRFEAKYNPFGEKTLRNIFLRIDNHIGGEYLAEITKEVIHQLESQKYQLAEYRLTVQGVDPKRWSIIANWICKHNIYSCNVRWIIQIPRIYATLYASGSLTSFHDMLCNIFEPLFAVTIDPSCNPALHRFLESVVGIDCVGDESTSDAITIKEFPSPSEWTNHGEPPYHFYLYHLHINLCILNRLRAALGLNVFAFRPQSGETGSVNHLAASFLVAHSINHGIRLYNSPVLQYMYYLEQIGIAVSPLSNNILYQRYDSNPLKRFVQRGMNVSLATDDPLLIHYTEDALLEEYSIAAQVYSFSAIDLCEIARNSVKQCGWDHATKQEWIGKHYDDRHGAESNDIMRTNVPNARVQFRYFLWNEEREFVENAGKRVLKAIPELEDGQISAEKTEQIVKDEQIAIESSRRDVTLNAVECIDSLLSKLDAFTCSELYR